jgi:hypothetical protein
MREEKSMAKKSQVCPSCKRLLVGDAETYEWDGNQVCGDCFDRMTDDDAEPGSPPPLPRAKKPKPPAVIVIGLALYIAAVVFSFAAAPDISPEQIESVMGLAMLAFLLLGLDVLGLVMAVRGRSWGAILMVCTTVAAVLVGLGIEASVGGIETDPLAQVVNIVIGVANLACFLVPPAWKYYRACDEFRVRSREGHA